MFVRDRVLHMPDELVDIDAVLGDICFKNYEYRLRYDEDRPYLQIWWPDADAGKRWHSGRKWFLSPYMTKGEVAQTALMATLAIEEHEVREGFTYKGKAIFGPHFNIDKLVDLCEKGDAIEERAQAISNTDRMPAYSPINFDPPIWYLI